MKGFSAMGILVLMALPIGTLPAQGNGGQRRPLRWSASADWEYFETEVNRAGNQTATDTFHQKYSLDLSGFLWEPRTNNFSLGVDLLLADQNTEGQKLDTDTLGYRFLANILPASPFPLQVFARRGATELTGVALASTDRDTSAWGVQWDLINPAWNKLLLRYGRSSFDILNPVVLEQRRKTGLVDFSKKFRNNLLNFRYNLFDSRELVGGNQVGRHDFYLTNRGRFRNGGTLNLDAHYRDSVARFFTGIVDPLNTSRLSARYEQPRGTRAHFGVSYQFLDNEGTFLDSTSHIASTDGRFLLGRGFWSTGSLSFGRIHSVSVGPDINQTLRGIGAGLKYDKDWLRSRFGAYYSIGYNDTDFEPGTDRQVVSHHTGVTYNFFVSPEEEFFASLSYNVDDVDTFGAGYTRDELRARTGWEGRLKESRRYRASVNYRDTTVDTFQSGMQESDEIALLGSMDFRDGGFSLGLSSSNGVSEFIPDPAAVSPFVTGPDLVSQSDVASAGIHWRFLRNLRFHMQVRMENQDFTSTGKQDFLSYNPQIDYNLYTWKFTIGYSYYERRNGTEFTDDTILLKVSKRFF